MNEARYLATPGPSAEDVAELRAEIEALRSENATLTAACARLKKQARHAERRARQWARTAETSENLSEQSKAATHIIQQALQASIEEVDQARLMAERAAESKGRFLAMMSHELRTPMNGVLGTLDILGRRPLDEESAELATIASESCRALVHIINDILDYSKLEAGAVLIERLPVDVASLVEGSLGTLMASSNRGQIDLRCIVDPQAPSVVLLDPLRVRQILLNLIGNALKFTADGHVEVRVGAVPDCARLRFEVEDTGIGIEPERLERLFEFFTQADETTQRRYGGTGLGLAICRQLCEAMGGEVGADSVLGVGSTFWFELPAPVSDAKELAACACPVADDSDAAKFADLGLRRVLVVDDNPVNRLVAERMLTTLDLQVETAENGEQAVQQVTAGDFDLVFMDCFMPGMDGYEATRRIRRLPSPRRANVPVVAMTAFTGEDARKSCVDAGMNGYLSKPMRRADIIESILSLAAWPGRVR